MEQYPFIIGALLPLVISLVKRATWTTAVKKYVALGVSAVAAIASYFIFQGAWVGWEQLIADWGIIYALAQTTYLGFWEDTGVENRLTGLLSGGGI